MVEDLTNPWERGCGSVESLAIAKALTKTYFLFQIMGIAKRDGHCLAGV